MLPSAKIIKASRSACAEFASFSPFSLILSHFILFRGMLGIRLDRSRQWICVGARVPSQLRHTHTHTCIQTHTYIHTCAGRGQCFSDEKPVCLFHIPLVPGATSEGRESAQTFLQDADVRIKSQTDSCTQRGRKTEQEKREREGERAKGRERSHARSGEERVGWDFFFLVFLQDPTCWNPAKSP